MCKQETNTPYPPVPFDPELAVALEQMLLGMPVFDSIESIVTARWEIAKTRVMTDEMLSRDGKFLVEDRTVPGPPDAPDISLLVIRPNGAASPGPVFYNIHGGGMIMGTHRNIYNELLDWAEEFNAAIISVKYRLAPETKHPGPVEDCYAGLKWAAEHSEEMGIGSGKIIIIGRSAGGGLAAATALLARDRGGPALAAQMLLCPMLDDRNNTPSAIQGEGRGVWDRLANKCGWTALLGEAQGGPDVSQYAAPARASDLSNLPPTYIDVGAAETFRDEAIAYANNIWYAGGQAELHVFSGVFHGHDGFVPQAAVSRDTMNARICWLRRIIM